VGGAEDGSGWSVDHQEATYGWCESDNTRLYQGIILGTNFVMMVIALIQAYEVRRITTEYSESLWIGGSIAAIAQIWIVGLPILRLVEENPKAAFLTKVGVIFGSSASTLGLIFGPKAGYLRDSLDAKREAARLSKALKDRNGGGPDDPKRHHPPSDTQSHSADDLDEDHDDQHAHPNKIPPRQQAPPKGVLGIRIVPSTVLHSDEVVHLQMAVERAEIRNRSLQGSLEKLQEKLEHCIIARDPLGSNNNNNNSNDHAGAVPQPSAAAASANVYNNSDAAATTGSASSSATGSNNNEQYRLAAGVGDPRNRIGSNSILAARPEGLLPPSTPTELSLSFHE
jgi:7 transmembrane sweet-taste receptor of 3 GCPR